MLELNPNCNNYKIYESSNRCPLTTVCNEDCVFVWKALYDGSKESDKDIEIEDLKYEIEDLQGDIFRLERELRQADEKIEQLEATINGDGE